MSFASWMREQTELNKKPEFQFKTFTPGVTTCAGQRITVSAAENLNAWLCEHPSVEILNWVPTAMTNRELYITIQYKEKEE
jgi:hypothetical protein